MGDHDAVGQPLYRRIRGMHCAIGSHGDHAGLPTRWGDVFRINQRAAALLAWVAEGNLAVEPVANLLGCERQFGGAKGHPPRCPWCPPFRMQWHIRKLPPLEPAGLELDLANLARLVAGGTEDRGDVLAAVLFAD